jgi:hypothetical protein
MADIQHSTPAGLPEPTDTSKNDIQHVYFCHIHNGCLLRDDTYLDGEVRKCRKHKYPVTDQTDTPMGHAYRHVVNPTPRTE